MYHQVLLLTNHLMLLKCFSSELMDHQIGHFNPHYYYTCMGGTKFNFHYTEVQLHFDMYNIYVFLAEEAK